MLICSNCQSKQLDGAIFCLECGASLLADGGRESTRPLADGGASASLGAAGVRSSGAPGRATLTLVVLASRRRITVEIADEVLIGRDDTARGIHPDIDLGPDGGYDAGVSRRHAILALREAGCTVEDLGSANGTFLNGRRLAPQAIAPLASGDELTCGTLRMRVELS